MNRLKRNSATATRFAVTVALSGLVTAAAANAAFAEKTDSKTVHPPAVQADSSKTETTSKSESTSAQAESNSAATESDTPVTE